MLISTSDELLYNGPTVFKRGAVRPTTETGFVVGVSIKTPTGHKVVLSDKEINVLHSFIKEPVTEGPVQEMTLVEW